MAQRIRSQDEVLVIAGKDRGKKGKVHRVNPREGKVLVEGVNVTKKHVKPRPGVRQAGIVEKESPLHISNVMLICTKCQKPARVSFRIIGDGTKVRVCRKCGEVMD